MIRNDLICDGAFFYFYLKVKYLVLELRAIRFWSTLLRISFLIYFFFWNFHISIKHWNFLTIFWWLFSKNLQFIYEIKRRKFLIQFGKHIFFPSSGLSICVFSKMMYQNKRKSETLFKKDAIRVSRKLYFVLIFELNHR